ncbi:MAG: hypothetical protein KAS94_11565 [Desulfobulbaceae bacterium]|nr:hypothetical protein [Desulfobulbaceae bacterium]
MLDVQVRFIAYDGMDDKRTSVRMNSTFLIAGTHSGCGKTTLTLVVLARFYNRSCSVIRWAQLAGETRIVES